MFSIEEQGQNGAPVIHIRCMRGLKKQRLSRSGAANHSVIATRDGSSGNHAQSAEKDSPRLFRACHAAGERVERN